MGEEDAELEKKLIWLWRWLWTDMEDGAQSELDAKGALADNWKSIRTGREISMRSREERKKSNVDTHTKK